jgi:L-alanine-DL-glutamate epimerase-like enolase superfamily enzyme
MAPLSKLEYFRLPPRWLLVKITDTEGNFGWGEASLEGHSEAVEGCLDAFRERFIHPISAPLSSDQQKEGVRETFDAEFVFPLFRHLNLHFYF